MDQSDSSGFCTSATKKGSGWENGIFLIKRTIRYTYVHSLPIAIKMDPDSLVQTISGPGKNFVSLWIYHLNKIIIISFKYIYVTLHRDPM